MRQVIQTYPHIKRTILLYLGSREKIETSSLLHTVENSGLQLLRIQETSELYDWLRDKLDGESGQFSNYAILCDYHVLKAENFDFLNKIQADESLKKLPFFVHVDQYSGIDKMQLLHLGVDDCLKTPVDWENVEKKIDFWLKYKTQIKEIRENVSSEEDRVQFISKGKRLFDIMAASIILILLSPVLLIIALLIKLDSKGPIFYKSKRVGAGYKVFDFWKFRSMHKDADERLLRLLHLNQYDTNSDNCFIKLKNDPRITRVGRIIRNTSLDELPQLFNVLRGEMSLVGNRPLPPYEAVMMVDDNRAMRFIAPAGLTGLWQVSKRGKSDMSTDERVGLDVRYAQNHSFWYDIKLLFKTFPAMIQEESV